MRTTVVRRHVRRKPKGGYSAVTRHQRGLKDLRPFAGVKGVSKYEVRTAVIVPSTTNTDEKISRAEFQKRVNETRRFLAEKNGGYTTVRAVGGYVQKNGRLVKEDVAVVESFATKKDYLKNRRAVTSFLQRKGREWRQESVGYEHEDDLYYVKV